METQVGSEHNDTEIRGCRRSKGGFITIPFIIANEAFEKVASYGLQPNMILYLMKDYNMGLITGTNLINLWSAATNFLPLLGAFLADSCLGRFLVIGLGSISSFLGTLLLWLTAMIPSARPAQTREPPTASQLALLISSFTFMSIGAGGIRSCSLAFGTNQVDKEESPQNKRVLETFFSWYYASTAASVFIAFTAIVYIQDHAGWKVGFGISVILMFLSTFFFYLASPLYIKQKNRGSLFMGFARVIVVAYRNRKLSFPPQNSQGWHHHDKDSKFIVPTAKLRFLNKACIIRSPEQDVTSDGKVANPWNLCSVENVEELKAVIRVFPLWSTGIMMSINTSQGSFQLLQAKSMDRHLTPSFEIPAASFSMFLIISLFLWIGLYDRILLPTASKLRGKPVRIAAKHRMGIGLFMSFLSMLVSGAVEHVRRNKAIRDGFQKNSMAVVDMSAMWLAPQFCLAGIAEALNAIGQNEFYYLEFPRSMSSIATSLFGLGMAVANLLATVILSTVDRLTGKGGKQSWVSTDINRGHYEYYYWLLAALSFINLGFFFVCSWAYGPSAEEQMNVGFMGRVGQDDPSKVDTPMLDKREGSVELDELSRLRDFQA